MCAFWPVYSCWPFYVQVWADLFTSDALFWCRLDLVELVFFSTVLFFLLLALMGVFSIFSIRPWFWFIVRNVHAMSRCKGLLHGRELNTSFKTRRFLQSPLMWLTLSIRHFPDLLLSEWQSLTISDLKSEPHNLGFISEHLNSLTSLISFRII